MVQLVGYTTPKCHLQATAVDLLLFNSPAVPLGGVGRGGGGAESTAPLPEFERTRRSKKGYDDNGLLLIVDLKMWCKVYSHTIVIPVKLSIHTGIPLSQYGHGMCHGHETHSGYAMMIAYRHGK